MIVVAGEALVDVIERPDGSVLAVPGGGPFNTARAIGRLGLSVAWAGVLSSDGHGQVLEAALTGDGVSLALVQRTDLPTTQALASLNDRGEASYRFIVDQTSAPALDGARLLAALPSQLSAVHVGTLGLVFEPIATALEALVAGLEDDVLLMVDPNCRPSAIPDPVAYRARLTRILERADVVKVSTADAAFLGVDIEAPVLVVTDGGGPVSVRIGDRSHEVAVPAVAVVDSVGAGDTFGGAMLARLVQAGIARSGQANEGDVLAAVRFAVRASSMVCQRAGADPPTLAELGGWAAP